MIIVSHTLKLPACQIKGYSERHEDHFELFDDLEGAKKEYVALTAKDDVYCAAISQVLEATEPHWVDDMEEPEPEPEPTTKEIDYFGQVLTVPTYAKAITCDSDGQIHAYEFKPLQAVHGFYFSTAGCYQLIDFVIDSECPYWHKSLKLID